MRRMLIALLIALLLLPPARAENAGPVCHEGRDSCLLLQLAMRGDFSRMDPADSLSVRIHAAVFPMLQRLTAEDIAHYLTEHPMAETELTRRLYAATGCCLWADILSSPAGEDVRENNSRQVLLLFLRDDPGSRDVEDRATIRSMMTDELLREMAEMNGVSPAFLEHLFYSDDWRDTDADSAV